MKISRFIIAVLTTIIFVAMISCSPSVKTDGNITASEQGVLSSDSTESLEETVIGENAYEELCSPEEIARLSYSEYKSDSLSDILSKSNSFAFMLAPSAYQSYDEDNFVISPISVFLALGMVAECAEADTREQILSALDISIDELRSAYSLLYRLLNVEHLGETESMDYITTGKLELSNTLWLDDGLKTNQDCLTALGDKYYCFGRAVDFDGANEYANKLIRDFIKERTNGLIDKDYNLSRETLLTIINTLYLKDVWNDISMPLDKVDSVAFTNADGSEKSMQMLRGYYVEGQAYESDTYNGFYTKTLNGYRLKFMMPKDGYTVDQVFTQENLSEFNSITDFSAIDAENRIRYYTCCIFPEYTVSYDEDIKGILAESFGISDLFSQEECNFKGLTESAVYCESIKHTVEFNVNDLGIEGAAVTLVEMAGSAMPEEYTEVFYDFIINKAFGFVLTDPTGAVIFSGVINTL